LRLSILLTLMAGIAVAVQAGLLSQAQKSLGPVMTAGLSGLAAGACGIAAALLFARPEVLGPRAAGLALLSGCLGAFIVASIAYGTGQGGIARTLSLVIGMQLIVGFLLDSFGVFGGGASAGLPKVVGIVLILVGGLLVVRS
jgi:transporter family-2 protein